MTAAVLSALGQRLDSIYSEYNRRKYVHPDPLEFLYGYEDIREREVVGIVASSLAYGRVEGIMKSVRGALERMGASPVRFVCDNSSDMIERAFRGFVHRFTTGEEFAGLLKGIGGAIRRFGSLENCFRRGLGEEDETVISAMGKFVEQVETEAGGKLKFLFPSPKGGSACKRLNLFLRWMVRNDDVDPGGWRGIPPALLVFPMDTHIYRICREFGITNRKQANLKTALEVTKAFRRIAPVDPVRYDFALSRFGIRKDFGNNPFADGNESALKQKIDNERKAL